VLYFSCVAPVICHLFFMHVVCCMCSWQIYDDDDDETLFNNQRKQNKRRGIKDRLQELFEHVGSA